MSAGTTPTSIPRASGWIALLVLFGITSTIEAFTVAHVFRFLPLYLGTVHVPPAEVPAWTGYLNAAFFLFGFALGPAAGGWLVDHGFLTLHTLFALDAAMSLAAAVMLLAFAREGKRPRGPSGSATRLALGALRLALTGRVTLIVFGVFGLAYFALQIANPFLPLLVIRLVAVTSGAAGHIGLLLVSSALLGATLSAPSRASPDSLP